MKTKSKAFLTVLCSILLVGATLFGTLAYLTDTTAAVENTFTVGELLADPQSFILKEHEAKDEDGDGVYTLDNTSVVDKNTYTVLPGVDLPKDPFVKTTEALKLNAYVFVEVVDATGTAVSFEVDSEKWTLLTGKTGQHGGKVYRLTANDGIAKAGSALAETPILKKNTKGYEITVKNEEITDAAAQFGGSVTFYGYMIQAGGFTDAAEAWAGLTAPST